MKKSLFLAFVIAAMTSCSQNDVLTEAPEAKQAPISFTPLFGNTVLSRTDIALNQSISLGVFAFNGTPSAIYDNIKDMRLRYVEDTATPANSAWLLNPAEHYYPSDDSEVSFWAYGPKGNTHLSSIDCDAAKGPKFSATLNSTDIGPTAVDVFATQTVATGKQSAPAAVAFTLKHLLAQVKFEAKANDADAATNYDIKIFDIDIETGATADYAESKWANYATTMTNWKPVDLDDTQATLTATAAPVGELVSLIPGQKTTITVKARLYKKNQSVMVTEQTGTIVLDNSTGKEYLAAGKSYTYTITVTPKVGKITFAEPKITDWEDTTGTVAVPNP